MTLRTPRRRISPQTKRRYRAIKGFFRRTLGSSSQPHLQITSSIALNVTDLKHKIVGLEQQLDEVGKQYRDFSSFKTGSGEPSRSVIATELNEDVTHAQVSLDSQTEPQEAETKVIYKTSNEQFRKFDESDCVHDANDEINRSNMNESYDEHLKTNRKKSKYDITPKGFYTELNLHKHKTKSDFNNLGSVHSTTSYNSLGQFRETFHCNPGYSGCGEQNKNHTMDQDRRHKDIFCKEYMNKSHENYHSRHQELENTRARKQTSKRSPKELDEDFITDIIRRQYKPISMFGRRESDFSQFSAPVCRDHEILLSSNNRTKDNPHLCDCCCGGRHNTKPTYYSDYSDIKSVCDARLYSTNRKSRARKHKRYGESYDDSEMYDLVPVKEKTSPKSRRKFFEDHMPSPAYYKEVPPSPRSQRPRLNLKAQYYTDLDDDMTNLIRAPAKRIITKSARRLREYEELEKDNSIKMQQIKDQNLMRDLNKRQNRLDMERINDEMGTMSSLQYPAFETEEIIKTDETVLNKTQETVSLADKTDKALCEIKDILQHFLQEIKKETSSHSGKSEVSSKIDENCNTTNDITNMPKSGSMFNNYKPIQCPPSAPPYVPAFANTCCYPIMPVCPMNCMQNSFAIPSTSFTCNNCATKCSEVNITKNDKGNETMKDTDELIKQIYEFVSKSPTFSRKQKDTDRASSTKLLTSRSAGGSTQVCRHNAKVGTPKMKSVSKSCEAIHSKIITDITSNDTNTSYSDTVLEKLSSEANATQSISETEISTDISEDDKAKRNKFAQVLRSLVKKKKNKRDVIQELSESESTSDVERNKKKPPFRQNVTNYSMHSQEYYRPPPVSALYRPEYQQSHRPPYYNDEHFYDPRARPVNDVKRHGMLPTAPPYSQSYDGYNQMQPQVPLCLKEVEVKSIGCQSERKISFLRKITQKIQQPVEVNHGDSIQRNCSTQTALNKPALFNWKNPQPKDNKNNPYAYSYKTQKKLAEGDMKMRNAMLKKMFYKRNPFSPRNLIIRTLMGKDKSSYGDPPAMYRPRMFI